MPARQSSPTAPLIICQTRFATAQVVPTTPNPPPKESVGASTPGKSDEKTIRVATDDSDE
ncbi:uncharacterized protein PG986_014441 [Apiospora aurea]|uniref:Uncharacterized protein n=1 Tax=Apiospora aurea TaxID=335848 RepID=A0ABR1PT26_9PEZI